MNGHTYEFSLEILTPEGTAPREGLYFWILRVKGFWGELYDDITVLLKTFVVTCKKHSYM